MIGCFHAITRGPFDSTPIIANGSVVCSSSETSEREKVAAGILNKFENRMHLKELFGCLGVLEQCFLLPSSSLPSFLHSGPLSAETDDVLMIVAAECASSNLDG